MRRRSIIRTMRHCCQTSPARRGWKQRAALQRHTRSSRRLPSRLPKTALRALRVRTITIRRSGCTSGTPTSPMPEGTVWFPIMSGWTGVTRATLLKPVSAKDWVSEAAQDAAQVAAHPEDVADEEVIAAAANGGVAKELIVQAVAAVILGQGQIPLQPGADAHRPGMRHRHGVRCLPGTRGMRCTGCRSHSTAPSTWRVTWQSRR